MLFRWRRQRRDATLGELRHFPPDQWRANTIFPPTGDRVIVSFEAPATGPTNDTYIQYATVISQYKKFKDAIAAMLFDHYSACRNDGFAQQLKLFPSNINTANDIWRTASLATITLKKLSSFSLSFKYDWDNEHDYSFEIRDGKLINEITV